jgi:serine/threonine-protein kinase RsbW
MSQSARIAAKQVRIPSDAAAAKQVVDEILAHLHQANWDEHDIFSVHLAVEEAVINAIKHGNSYDASKTVHVKYMLTTCSLRVEITDEGPGFTPEDVPDPTDDDNLEVPSGRGIMLMRSFMSLVEFNDKGNCVIMEKLRASATSQRADAS